MLYHNFEDLTLMMGVTDLLGPGEGPNLEVEAPFLVGVFLACQVTLYLLASLHAHKKRFLDTLIPDVQEWFYNTLYIF